MFNSPIIRRRGRSPLAALALAAATLVAGVVVAAVPTPAHAQDHFPATDDVESMLRYLVEDGETAGIVLGIVDEDGSTRVVSHGEAGPGTRPLGSRSLFEIGSITKTFTGTLLADMVLRGEMALDDPVQTYLPAGVTMPRWEDREITLQDLSTHHSGLPRLPDNFAPTDPENPYADFAAEDLYAFLNGHQLRRAPGAEYEYSNLAVGLLGHVLELASGMSYEDLVRERILDPLGMSMTGITLRGPLAEWMTKGHNSAGEVVPYWDVTALAGAGGLRSTVDDMLKYVSAQMDPPDTPLGRAIAMTHEPRVRMENSAGGLGWAIRTADTRRILSHGGGTAGYSTLVAFDPDLGVGIVRLANTGEFEDDIGMDLIRRGAPLDLGDVDVPESALSDYAGLYEVAPGEGISVRLEPEGWLTMQAPGNVRFRMYAENDSSFYVKRTPWRFFFHRGEAGGVTGMTADLDGSRRQTRKTGTETPGPRAVAGNAVEAVRDIALPHSQMTLYEGTYTLAQGARTLDVRVFIDGSRLMAQPDGQDVSVLRYQGDSEFVLGANPRIRLSFTFEEGRAETMTLHQGGAQITGRRNR